MGFEENAVQNMVIEYLVRVPGVLKVGRLNNVAVYDKKRGAYRAFGKYAIYGLPDVQVFAKPGVLPFGTFGVIEAKSKEGKTSPEQREYLEMVAASGNTAVLARSLDDMIRVIDRRVPAELGTGVFVPSQDWHMGPSHIKTRPPVYGGRDRWARR